MVKTGDYQCTGLLKRWFKTCERPWKAHLKWNSTLNRNLNAELLTTADSKQVRGREKSIQNGTLNRYLWLRLIQNQWEAVFVALFCSVSYYFIVIIVIIIRRHSCYCVPFITYCYHLLSLLLSSISHNIIIIIIIGWCIVYRSLGYY